jgi:hypothetical protein
MKLLSPRLCTCEGVGSELNESLSGGCLGPSGYPTGLVSYVQLISKVPVYVGWVPYQNLFVNVNILKPEMKEMREHMDEKMEHMDEKMEHMDEKMEHMDEKMEYIAKVVDSLAKVVDSLAKEVDSQKLVDSCICACILLAIAADKVFYK